VLVSIAKNQGWSRDDITLLSKLSAKDFYDLFKKQEDEDLGRVVRSALHFAQIGGAGEEEKSISAKAREALVQIGKESPINRRRVRKFGVQVEEETAVEVLEHVPPLRAEQAAAAQAQPTTRRSRGERHDRGGQQ
jgi:hypothetical protein